MNPWTVRVSINVVIGKVLVLDLSGNATYKDVGGQTGSVRWGLERVS
jgi:hypothetical protein